MKLLFTRSNSITSKIGIYFLDEPVTHFAISWHGWVYEHTFFGFRKSTLKDFQKKQNVVFALEPIRKSHDMTKIMNRIESDHMPKPYDFLGWAYMAWRVVLRKFLRLPLPKVNKWQLARFPICVTLAKPILSVVPLWLCKHISDYDMTTPYALYLNLNSSGNLRPVEV